MTLSAPASIDTLRAFDELRSAGLDEAAARAVVDTINEAIADNAVTTGDLRTVEKRLGERIAALQHGIDTLAVELDKKIELQGVELRTRNAQALSETTRARADITGRISRLTRTLVVLFLLAPVLVFLWELYAADIAQFIARAGP